MPEEKKECKIINCQFCWLLCVDNREVQFQGFSNAEYFEEHYKELGYEVEWMKEGDKDV